VNVDAARDAAERVARERYGRLVAYLASRSGDVHAAEDALGDAFAAALEHWPRDGVPDAPEAWLLVAARRRLIDAARRSRTRTNAEERLERAALEAQADFERSGELPDERLALMYGCAHPAIAQNVRAPLILQTVLGFDAARVAAAFLVAPSAMSQRLVRAKRKIAAARIPLRVAEEPDEKPRRDAVLEAIYAAYTAGWDDDDDALHGFDEEATWLARYVVAGRPNDPEALGLLALFLFCSSRSGARRDRNGAFVPLDEQDVLRWDVDAIAEAESLLFRASRERKIGRFQLEAAIQSAHAARRTGPVDWAAIVALYDALVARTGSIVAAVNRAVAVARASSPKRGIAALDALAGDPRLRSYQPYWAARAALLREAHDPAARAAYERAIGLASDPAVRAYLARESAMLECVDRSQACGYR
jgi:RNA polymerase sigma-70 factor (ECF subfamily)